MSGIFFAMLKVGDVPAVLAETDSSSHWCFVAQYRVFPVLPLITLAARLDVLP